MKTILTALAAGLMVAASSSSVAGPPLETAVLAGGCYWGMDSVYEHVKGVRGVISGWAGGSDGLVHAEAVQIRFDPSQISYQQLLQIYFTVAHDPTQVNRQGPDVGVNYRSAIFPRDPEQQAIASQTIAKLQAARAYPRPIATRLEKGGFHAAPLDQQDFARKHPDLPYIVINDDPKLAHLKQAYPQWWKA